MKLGTTTTSTPSCVAPATVALLALALGGCSAFAPLMPAPDAPPPAPPPPIVSKDGLAPITDEQVERIRGELSARTPPPAVAKVVRGASPTIESFVRTESCITARNGAVLNPFAAPGRLFDNPSAYPGGPMLQMQYHDKTACVTVKKIQNWKMVSPKLLRFDVIYVGDDGQERTTKRHELTRQPKGGWLFTK